jgi:hypothetical protein
VPGADLSGFSGSDDLRLRFMRYGANEELNWPDK